MNKLKKMALRVNKLLLSCCDCDIHGRFFMEYEFDLQSVVCIQVIAENLSEEEIAGLKEMFKMMDTDNSGQINFEELKAGLQRVGANMKEPEIYQLMQAVSLFCLNFFP